MFLGNAARESTASGSRGREAPFLSVSGLRAHRSPAMTTLSVRNTFLNFEFRDEEQPRRSESFPGERREDAPDPSRSRGSTMCTFTNGARCEPCLFHSIAKGCNKGAGCGFCHTHMYPRNPSKAKRERGRQRGHGPCALNVFRRGEKLPETPGRVS